MEPAVINQTSSISVASGASFNYSSSTALGVAPTIAAGGSFVYNSSTPLAVAPTLSGASTVSRAILAGSGTINTALTLNNLGDTLSPGNSPGIMEFVTNQSWSSMSYDWEVNDWSADVVGTNIDQIQIDGTLDLSGSAYRLNVLSLRTTTPRDWWEREAETRIRVSTDPGQS